MLCHVGMSKLEVFKGKTAGPVSSTYLELFEDPELFSDGVTELTNIIPHSFEFFVTSSYFRSNQSKE